MKKTIFAIALMTVVIGGTSFAANYQDYLKENSVTLYKKAETNNRPGEKKTIIVETVKPVTTKPVVVKPSKPVCGKPVCGKPVSTKPVSTKPAKTDEKVTYCSICGHYHPEVKDSNTNHHHHNHHKTDNTAKKTHHKPNRTPSGKTTNKTNYQVKSDNLQPNVDVIVYVNGSKSSQKK